MVVEHRLARLVQLSLRQSRYFGRVKTRCQLYLAATVANLTLVAAKAGLTGKTGSGPSASSAQVAGMVNSAAIARPVLWKGRLAKVVVVAVPDSDRAVPGPQLVASELAARRRRPVARVPGRR